MSYFAKPNFIVYDEWFDTDLEKNKPDDQNKKLQTISNLHEFFYEKSNFKIGGSENNLQLDLKINSKEILSENVFENTEKTYTLLSHKKFRIFEKLKKSKIKLNQAKRLIYFLLILAFILIFGFVISTISS